MEMNSTKSNLHTVFGKQAAAIFLKGVNLFNKGKHWEAHEVFEDVWRLHEGDVKMLAQGFVQLAAAFSYVEKKRYESILYLFDKCVEKLSAASHLLPQVDIPQLIAAVTNAKEEIKRLGENGLEKFNPSLYPHIDLTPRSSQSRTKSRKKRKRR